MQTTVVQNHGVEPIARLEAAAVPKDTAAFGQQLVHAIGAKLKEQGKPYTVTLGQKPASIQGGMILAEGNIETNLSYEILIKNMRDELEAEVAKVLTE